MMVEPPVAVALAVALAAGCNADDAPEPESHERDVETRVVSLIDPSAWAVAADEDDPLPDHRPDELVCSPQPWHAVGEGIEVDTGICNYIHLTTPLTRDLEKGDPLEVSAWWSTLASTEPAQGHLALFIGGQLAWETHVDIPGPADARTFEFPAAFSAREGEDVTFHLHNHGFNTWTLQRFAVLEQSP